MSDARASLRVMAVQCDKRPWYELLVANGRDETERHRVGIWTLTAPRIDHAPATSVCAATALNFPEART